MKTCDQCKYASWKRTAAGRLHPSKDGVCTYKYTVPPLPACMYWLSSSTPCGGHIKRGEENREHCPYWARAEVLRDLLTHEQRGAGINAAIAVLRATPLLTGEPGAGGENE